MLIKENTVLEKCSLLIELRLYKITCGIKVNLIKSYCDFFFFFFFLILIFTLLYDTLKYIYFIFSSMAGN